MTQLSAISYPVFIVNLPDIYKQRQVVYFSEQEAIFTLLESPCTSRGLDIQCDVTLVPTHEVFIYFN